MGFWVFYFLVGLHTLILKLNANFYVLFNERFLDKFFDLYRAYQQEIPPQKMAKVLRAYADRLDELWILAELRNYLKNIIYKKNLYNFF